MLDCITDAMQWDPIHGVQRPNARYYRPGVRRGDFSIGIASGRNRLELRARRLQERPIHEVFAVEANLACYFQNADRPYLATLNNHTITRPVRQLAPYEFCQHLLDARPKRYAVPRLLPRAPDGL